MEGLPLQVQYSIKTLNPMQEGGIGPTFKQLERKKIKLEPKPPQQECLNDTFVYILAEVIYLTV